MREVIEALKVQGKVTTERLKAIRVKVHVPCQWTCEFCHMEGNHHSQSIKDLQELEDCLKAFRDEFGFEEAHYTGGEPTLHKQLPEMVQVGISLGMSVRMTSNAQASTEKYLDLVSKGLTSLNVSLLSMDPARLGALMAPPRDTQWGEDALRRQLGVIDALRSLITVKVNTAIGSTLHDEDQIFAYTKEKGLEWRGMNVLGDPGAYDSMDRLATQLGATPVQLKYIAGSSSFSVKYSVADGGGFSYKLIRPFRLKSQCEGCVIDQRGACQEYSYGPRLEKVDGLLQVRSCLHRSEAPSLLPWRDYLAHGISDDQKKALYSREFV